MPSPTAFQRIEGAALLVLALAAFGIADLSWWWFALLLLVPDLTMVGYLANEETGALVYNIGHTLVWPALLLAWGLPTDRPWVVGIGAIWLAHIGIDRALGYGLKLPEGFQHTHLGVIGAVRRSQ
jgi:Domain of unknown function (DUF4260)